MNNDSYTAKEYFIKFRNELGFEKSRRYLQWAKMQHPDKDLHHLLGSTVGRKFTDYLVVPITHEEHLLIAERFKALFFIQNLHKAIKLLIKYVQYLEGLNAD